jgi:hypothetical protein
MPDLSLKIEVKKAGSRPAGQKMRNRKMFSDSAFLFLRQTAVVFGFPCFLFFAEKILPGLSC